MIKFTKKKPSFRELKQVYDLTSPIKPEFKVLNFLFAQIYIRQEWLIKSYFLY